jgi:hypothetical protein
VVGSSSYSVSDSVILAVYNPAFSLNIGSIIARPVRALEEQDAPARPPCLRLISIRLEILQVVAL